MHKATALALGALIAAVGSSALAAEKNLKIGVGAMPPFKGNAFTGNGPPGVFLWNALHNTVTDIDDKGNVQPMVASRWQNIDPTTWRFTIRPNVTFHNGKTADARAIVEAVAFLNTDKGKTFSVSRNVINAGIVAVTAVDPMTVEVKTSRPNPIIPTNISILPVFEPDHFAAVGADRFGLEPVGAGPFKVERWTPNGVMLVRHDAYWKGKPKLDRIEFIEIPEGPARVQALVSGQIDIDNAVTPDAFELVKRSGGKIDDSPAPRVMGISLVSNGQKDDRGKKTPFADARVRRAVNLAVDRKAIIEGILGGLGRPGTTAATSASYGFIELPPYRHDPAEARRLLSEAGYPNGFRFLVQATVTDPSLKLMYEQAVNDINRHTPIKAELVPITFAVWLQHYQQGTWEGDGFGFGYFLAPEMDAQAAFNGASCDKKPEVSIYYCDQAEYALLNQVKVEFDPAKRKALIADLLKMHYANSPILVLIETRDTMGVAKRVKNFKNVNLKINYDEIDVE
jgi:peptide/nickel transport system substrate-binding protein